MRRTCIAVVLAAAACEGVDGDTGPTTVEFRDEADTFSVRYVTPPWEVVAEDARHIELEISAEVFGVAVSGSPPTHAFQIGLVDRTDGIGTIIGDQEGVPVRLVDLGGGSLADSALVPPYLRGVNLYNPRAVALAELTYLIDAQEAELRAEAQSVITGTGQEAIVYQVVLAPGLFVRTFYFATSQATARATFASLFELDTRDVELMVDTIETDLAREATQ